MKLDYIPFVIEYPRVLNAPTSWGANSPILKDIILRFNLKTDIALEFGVWGGYSSSVLACYFTRVIGVDSFSEFSTGYTLLSVMRLLRDYPNINLVAMGYENFIKESPYDRYDIIHIDISDPDHNYKTTYPCGEWSIQHTDCVILHDTVSFPEMDRVCEDLSDKYDFSYFNYTVENGLGILVKNKLIT